ncbi:MAG: DNA polymerase III subunit beta [Planctomycetes bacterium]|nr:DNA polymerase III subunit beta [Planctomycetota bacterium]MBI3848259.1 DNA polymerase III subunit beta [Planctomycetota bacterium]
MKIRCRRKELLDGFQAVASVVSPKAIKPILQCVKLTPEGSRIELLATDLDVSMRYWSETLSIEGEGVAVLPGLMLTSILRETSAEEVLLDIDQDVCNIRVGADDFRIRGLDADEFPVIPAFSDGPVVEVGAAALREMIHRTAFAAAREKTRYALNAVLLHVSNDDLEVVATDGRRLSYCIGKVTNSNSTEKSVLLSLRGILQFERSLAPEDEVGRLDIQDNLVVMKTPRAEVSTRVVEGTFPSYSEVIPKQGDKVMEVKAGVFSQALRRASILADDESRCVRLVLSKNRLTLFSRSTAVGEAKVEIEVGYRAADFEIHFNPDYLVDGLKVLPDDQDVSLEMTEKGAPGKIVVNDGYSYVIMPINLE